MSSTTGLQINFNHENIPDLARDMAINLYRMLMEIIHNTIKHAKATHLNIELKTKNNTLVVLTEDNGSGFDHASAVQEKSGLGLRSLLSRTDIMGGEMFIESKPGKGTRYIFEIPLN
jgi:signal transduction histidine kinase